MLPGRENWEVPWAQTDDEFTPVRSGSGYTPVGGREYANYQYYFDPLAENQNASKLSPSQRMWQTLNTPIPQENLESTNRYSGIYQTMEQERQQKVNRVRNLMTNQNMPLDAAVDRVTLRDIGANQPRRSASMPSYAEYLRTPEVAPGTNWKSVPEKMSPGGYGFVRGLNALGGAFERSLDKAFSGKPKPQAEYYTRPIESQADYKRSGLGRIPLGLRNLGESAISTSTSWGFGDQKLFGRPAGELIPTEKQTLAQRAGTKAGWFSPTGIPIGGTLAGPIARGAAKGMSGAMRGAARGMESLGIRGVKSFTPDALRNRATKLTDVAEKFRTNPKPPSVNQSSATTGGVKNSVQTPSIPKPNTPTRPHENPAIQNISRNTTPKPPSAPGVGPIKPMMNPIPKIK